MKIIHISDLHFGKIYPGDLQSVTLDWWRFLRLFDGFMGHDLKALTQLEDFINDIRYDSSDDVYLVVTGDLTAFGSSQQFHLALNYIRRRLIGFSNIPPIGVGLNWPDAFLIPGNHDNWPGILTILGPRTRSFDQTFREAERPWLTTLPLGQRQVVLMGIDTDADVSPMSHQRVFAQGAFTNSQNTGVRNQLRCLEQRLAGLPGDPQRQVRVLMLHHSPALQPGRLLSIEPKSHQLLRTFVARYDVRVLLTGHLHTSHIGQAFSDLSTTWEFRCGTTTQLTHYPNWHPRWRGNDPLPPNTLLVHDLEGEGERVRWTCTTYVRGPYGFSAMKSPLQVSVLF